MHYSNALRSLALRSLALLAIAFSVSSTQVLAQVDLLQEDEFALDSVAGLNTDAPVSHWSDGFVTSLEHSQTHIEEGRQYQRSGARLQYDYAVAKGWYVSLDYQYRYYWPDDDQVRVNALTNASADDDGYTRGNWQQAWVQYSQGACAYKLGKQTLIWGNVEGTFAVDVVTPFDYTEQLLTDYSSLRLAQTMAVADCFMPAFQAQVFYVPEARQDIFSHGAQTFPAQQDEEYGGLVKFNWEGGDVSLMAARLMPNQPTLTFNAFFQPQWQSPMFEFYGVSSSIAVSRLLLKMDLGFKLDQVVEYTNERHDVMEFAAGFEYTTASNHNINAGFWVIKDLEEGDSQSNLASSNESRSQSPLYTFGWSKSYWNDDLSMSLLGNITTDPELYAVTLLAQYQYNDYWQYSAALGVSELVGEVAQSFPVPPDESLTLQVKFQF